MSQTVTDTGPFEKLVLFRITEEELDQAKTRAARRLSRELKIRGFRPGRAPRPIVEATVGSETLRREAIEEILPEKVAEVLTEAELEPAVTPELERIEDATDGVEVEVKVTLWPTLTEVPEHHGRRIEVGSPEVTDEEVDGAIDGLREQFATLTTVDRPARLGDVVSVDVSATVDGVEVEEAKASELLYEVGHGGFIEGIDDVLQDMSAGESATFDSRLPDGFGDKAGMEVTFHITVTEVKEKVLPELTDEWVGEVTEFDTVEEFRAALRRELETAKKRRLAASFRERALQELVDQVEIELPEALVRAEMQEILHRFYHRLEERGISLEDYFRVSGLSSEQFSEDLRLQAERSIRTRLLLEAVADRDGIEVDQAELDQAIEALAAASRRPDDVRRALREGPGGKSLAGDILRNKALAAIVAGAIPVDEQGNEVDLTIEEEPPVVEAEVVEAEAGVVEAEVVAEEE
jgi:trigger factor